MHPGERFNSWSHLVGLVLAIAGLPLLIWTAAGTGRAVPIVTFSIYGTTLVLMYLLSTLYHVVRGHPKAIFRRLDHVAIYLLIAGTYTPISLVALGGWVGWTMFGVNWGLALAGSILEFVPWKHSRIVALALYPAMGWLAILALIPLSRKLGLGGSLLVIAGGLLYTLGLLFYGWKRLPHHHGIWHLFVLGGSVCHFVLVLLYVR